MNETEQILTDLLNCSRTELYLKHPDLSCQEERKFLSIVEQRKKGMPLQYILSKCEFFCLEFKVRPGVFIPRPETELLVEEAIKRSPSHQVTKSPVIRILDIGTGSGNIAISLAKNIPQAKITAVDISPEAITLAKENAQLHGVEDRIEFVKGDIYEVTKSPSHQVTNFDIIVSNPPYIKTGDIENLPIEVKHEPRIALEAGKDGLDFYRKIIKFCKDILKPNGLLLFEIGFGQAPEIMNIVTASNAFKIIQIIKDYNKIERVIVLNKS